MDPRWKPHLEHPPTGAAATPEVRALLAAGCHASATECWVDGAQGPERVALDTWRGLRELQAAVRPRVQMQ